MVDMTDWYDDFIREEKIDEKIIELRDIVKEEKESPAEDDDIIDLEEIVEDDDAALDFASPEKGDVTSGEALEPEQEISFKEAVELEMDEPDDEIPFIPYAAPAPRPESDLNVTREQMEAALERVIEKKFADQIEGMLLESMEKVIKKEILEIKARLLEDLDQMETV